MNAPDGRRSISDVLRAIDSHVRGHYDVRPDLSITCKRCGGEIRSTPLVISIHTTAFASTCSGSGQVLELPLPFCPKCEGEPTKTRTCAHEDVTDGLIGLRPAGDLALDLLEFRFPWVSWREPIEMQTTGTEGVERFYACRVCVAQKGIKGTDVPSLPKTREGWLQHWVANHEYPLTPGQM